MITIYIMHLKLYFWPMETHGADLSISMVKKISQPNRPGKIEDYEKVLSELQIFCWME